MLDPVRLMVIALIKVVSNSLHPPAQLTHGTMEISGDPAVDPWLANGRDLRLSVDQAWLYLMTSMGPDRHEYSL